MNWKIELQKLVSKSHNPKEKKIIFMIIFLILAPKIDFEKWKRHIFSQRRLNFLKLKVTRAV